MKKLTQREYFAALAMQGELANSDDCRTLDACIFLGIERKDYDWATHYPEFLAKHSVQYADALIKELNK